MPDLNKYNTSNYEYKKEILRLQNEIEQLNKDKNNQIVEKNKIQEELNRLQNSKSWRITKPIRKVLRITKKITENQANKIQQLQAPKKERSNYSKLRAYNSTYQDNKDFSNYKTDIKTLAFYLPQYHEFKENNEWWGKGFMEWTNTKKAKKKFPGHYQPRTPHKDFGYYKLDNIETIKKQVNLAKQHGLYGFCFYYYWFSGKRLMEKPVDLFLKDKSIDFPFCLCWANENWTRTWDGLESDILIKQSYTKDDPKQFIKDIKKYLDDKRYIKIDGKPLIMIYNPGGIPNFKDLINKWRKTALEIGIGEICIWSKMDLCNTEHEFTDYVDGEFDFPPHGIGHKETKIYGLPSEKIFNYEKIVKDIEHLYKEHFTINNFYYTCTMGWDNSARKNEDYTVYYNYSLESYYKWLRILIRETRRRNPKDKRFLLINAWNEWAEGTYLEPDKKYGYANINTLSKAIFDIPLKKNEKKYKI